MDNYTGEVRENQLTSDIPARRVQGHWLLAKMGKRVLRPGGIELTHRIIEHARPSSNDRIVEFGPGVGTTATILLAANPRSYVGVDPNPEGGEQMRELLADYPAGRLVNANAQHTGLPDESADLVVGEAMLTMHSDQEKAAIIAEAFRILAPGGRYAVHELGLHPDDLPDQVEKDVAKALSRTIKVGARPLTTAAWSDLFAQAGFTREYASTNPMHLLEPQRIIADEGLGKAIRFAFNVLTHKPERERILAMRKVFRRHQDHINAVGFVFTKPKAS